MMKSTIPVLLVILAVSSAFSPVPRARSGAIATQRRLAPLGMVSADNDDKSAAEKPLETIDGDTSTPLESSTIDVPKMKARNLARGGEEIEVNFYDPAMVSE